MRVAIVSACLCALLFGGGAPSAPAAEAEQAAARAIRLPRDAPVPVRLDYGVSAKSARVDDPVYMKVAQAVAYNGVVVIPEGAPVKGRVSEAGGSGASADIVIMAEYVTVGEDRIRLYGTTADQKKKRAVSVNDGVLTIPLGRRKTVNLPAGSVFFAYTDQNY